MIIEAIRVKNFKAFKDTEMENIPKLCIIVGANGSGKSTIFSIFSFLGYAMSGTVNSALIQLGGRRGFKEVRTRGEVGPIEIEIKFRVDSKSPLTTYFLQINEENGKAFVEREILKYRRGKGGQPWHFLDFANGKGNAVTNEMDYLNDDSKINREAHSLKSNDILAIKGLAQFKQFPAIVAFGGLLENWHISDFHISKARPEQEAGFADHLSREGENLSLVIEYLANHHPDTFTKILQLMQDRIPGVSKVESKTTEEGRVLLKIQDGAFEDPFLARYVSDGTIKMLAYLTLLYDPKPHPLLCVEEPENQLYPTLLLELVEEFRNYANSGSQVFVSTHSPDLLNATELKEVFWLKKINGHAIVKRASQDKQICEYMNDGDKMGYLWKQGFFGEVDPI